MELEEQVTNLEISRELKSLGVKQESLFYWWVDQAGTSKLEMGKPTLNFAIDVNLYSAFTCSELGEMLAYKHLKSFKGNACTWRYYTEDGGVEEGRTEVDARGKMLIHFGISYFKVEKKY